MSEEEARKVIENYFTYYMSENPELALAVSIVLKALEKKDRQLEERTNRIRNLEKECQKYFDNMMETIKELSNKEAIIDEMAKSLKEYANLGFLIKCPAEYDGKYNYKYCKIDITKDRTKKTNRLCTNCIKEYFIKLVEDK